MADIEATLRQMSNENTAKTFAFNMNEAQKARDFEKVMSNTSHQREVEDLKRAGLNPVLSSNSGANSYSASSASGSADNSAVGVLASIYQTKMNNDNAIQLAKLQNKNNLKIAKINAAASNYASNNATAASKYNTDVSSATSIGNSRRSTSAQRYSSDKSYKSSSSGMIDDTFGKHSKIAKGVYLGTQVFGNLLSSFIKKKK